MIRRPPNIFETVKTELELLNELEIKVNETNYEKLNEVKDYINEAKYEYANSILSEIKSNINIVSDKLFEDTKVF